jgi:hypothetical protein
MNCNHAKGLHSGHGAGAITYIVGPVTGAALGADSTVMAVSLATGGSKKRRGPAVFDAPLA